MSSQRCYPSAPAPADTPPSQSRVVDVHFHLIHCVKPHKRTVLLTRTPAHTHTDRQTPAARTLHNALKSKYYDFDVNC